jgi:protein-tyrosine phosphatase
MTRVLFVCLGNICRSPLAECVFRSHVERAGLQDAFEIDSAGTGGWHVGEAPDRRSVEVAARHGIDISAQQARKFVAGDLERFDEVLYMDLINLTAICQLGAGPARVGLLLDEVAGSSGDQVPDPYYGGRDGFEQVFRMVDQACGSLLDRVR